MTQKSFQDYYTDETAHCYGCGRLNEQGLHIQSYWDGDESICAFTPKPYHTAFPGIVYGGLIASIIDCHSIGTAGATVFRAEARSLNTEPLPRFVTASLHIEFLKPTPIQAQLIVRGRVKEIKGHKVTVATELSANGEVCARGEVVAVRMPESFIAKD